MAIQEYSNTASRGHYHRFLWLGAAVVAVLLALGAVHLLNSVSAMGAKPLASSIEMPKEEHPPAPLD